MRYRLMATYQGSPFEAGIGPAEGDIVLFAACPPPEDLGLRAGHRTLAQAAALRDVQAVWESRPVGTFRGERCMVLDDLGDRLHIGYLGHDGFKAEQLGYWQVDRGVFELVAPRTEVTEILEERTEYARPQPVAPGSGGGAVRPGGSGPAATSSQSRPHPADGPYYSGPGPGPAVPAPPQPPGPSPRLRPHAAPAEPRRPRQAPAGDHASGLPAVPDGTTGVALPARPGAAAPGGRGTARASAARRPPVRRPAARGSPAVQPLPPAAARRQPGTGTVRLRGRAEAPRDRQPRQAAGRRRLATERLFADLASLAGIPADSYCVGEEVDGALCLVQTETGFEVFHSAGGARHELQLFATEEAACFYLFGVLAAEAVSNGSSRACRGQIRLASPDSSYRYLSPDWPGRAPHTQGRPGIAGRTAGNETATISAAPGGSSCRQPRLARRRATHRAATLSAAVRRIPWLNLAAVALIVTGIVIAFVGHYTLRWAPPPVPPAWARDPPAVQRRPVAAPRRLRPHACPVGPGQRQYSVDQRPRQHHSARPDPRRSLAVPPLSPIGQDHQLVRRGAGAGPARRRRTSRARRRGASVGPAVFYELGELRPGARIFVRLRSGRTAIFETYSVVLYAKAKFPTRRGLWLHQLADLALDHLRRRY